MIYRPRPGLRLWDTWMLRENGNYHLFALTSTQASGGRWDRICHAVTTDFINWEDWEDIILAETADKDRWDAGVILTGSTFKCDRGYAMTFGVIKPGDKVQRIGICFSKDLHHWEKYPGNPVLVPKGPFYDDDPAATVAPDVPWRDAYVIPVRGGYEALITASDRSKTRTVDGCVARAFSRDLVHWEYLPPIVSPGRYADMEVPQYFELNGYHYILFSTLGSHVEIPSRAASTGTYYLVADSNYGAYSAPADNLLIGSGEGRVDCYAGKVIFTDLGPLLCHHINGEKTALAAPKVLRQDGRGRLWLERWKGLDGLLGETVVTAASPGATVRAVGRFPIGAWQSDGRRLTGDAGSAVSGWLFDQALEDCAIRATLNLGEASRAGVLFRVACPLEAPKPGAYPPSVLKGLALCIDRKRGVVQLCEAVIESSPTIHFKPLDTVYLRSRKRYDVEIFLRAEYVEIYCNRRPLFVLNGTDYALKGRSDYYAPRGKVGLYVGEGRATFNGFRVREIPVRLR